MSVVQSDDTHRVTPLHLVLGGLPDRGVVWVHIVPGDDAIYLAATVAEPVR